MFTLNFMSSVQKRLGKAIPIFRELNIALNKRWLVNNPKRINSTNNNGPNNSEVYFIIVSLISITQAWSDLSSESSDFESPESCDSQHERKEASIHTESEHQRMPVIGNSAFSSQDLGFRNTFNIRRCS
jgi:hypothetical protein